MCFDLLTKLFGGKPSEPVLTIPHPQQPINESATIHSVSIRTLLEDFFTEYEVSEEYHPFWEAINIELIENFYVPAATYSEIKLIRLDPKWANVGVVAHEFCHISYSLLNEVQKVTFEVAYNEVQSDSYIKLLHSTNTYMDSVDSLGRHVEGHADCYRFLGLQMPAELKQFYPSLI